MAPNPEKGDQDEVLLVEDLEYHSLALLELAFALEDEFDLPPIDEQSVQNIRTAADIENHVVRQLESKDAEPLAATTE
nr:acyl carrier protein [Micromonospora sp. ANENR4]